MPTFDADQIVPRRSLQEHNERAAFWQGLAAGGLIGLNVHLVLWLLGWAWRLVAGLFS